METYFTSCKKYTDNKDSNIRKTKPNCTVCNKKKSTFIKNKKKTQFLLI